MKKIKITAILLCLILTVLSAACSTQPSGSEIDEIYDRLELLDEFYEQSVPKLSDDSVSAQAAGSFRDVPFGESRSAALAAESLTVSEQYTNAVDFEDITIFGYNMTPTYWFNSLGQLYRGTYYMNTTESIDRLISSFSVRLSELYGSPADNNYYTYDNEIADTSDENPYELIDKGLVYYYSYYISAGADVELIIEAGEQGCDVFVMYTDYTYFEN